MAKTRLTFQQFLKTKTARVYFQPDENIKLTYPCIVYSKTRLDSMFADDKIHKLNHGYKLIYITRDPDDALIDELVSIPYARFLRQYNVNGLYHNEYIIYWN